MSIQVRDGKPGEIIHEEQDGAAGQDAGPSEPDSAWVAFFMEARRLAALARERRAARETVENQDASQTDQRPLRDGDCSQRTS